MANVVPFGTEARQEFKDLTFEEIMDWCVEKGKVGWLTEAMNRKMEHWKYQRVSVIGADGKKRKVVDKTLPKVLEYRKPTFIELKEMYLVEICGIAPAKKKIKPLTMEEKLALRLGQLEEKDGE